MIIILCSQHWVIALLIKLTSQQRSIDFDNCAHLKYLVVTSISNFDQFLSHLFDLHHRINTVKQWPLCEDIGLMCRMSGSVLHWISTCTSYELYNNMKLFSITTGNRMCEPIFNYPAVKWCKSQYLTPKADHKANKS